MDLNRLLQLNRTIRVVGFDDAPFQRGQLEQVAFAGVVCAGTRFEGMVWSELTVDGWDATDRILQALLPSKFLPQLHLVLLDGITFGGLNVIDLPKLNRQLNLPCVTVMRRYPKLEKMHGAIARLPNPEQRLHRLEKAGPIHQGENFCFQVQGEEPELIANVIQRLSDRGHVPEALRLAHLITAAVITGESGKQA